MSGDQLDLDAIEARVQAATPGPWNVDGPWWHEGEPPTAEDMVSGPDRIAIAVPASPHCERGDVSSDMRFIAHAREDVPALVAEVRRLREERDALRTSVAGLKASLNFKQGTIDDLSRTVETLEAE